eukprot:scaffold14471_cov113-Isochrysis_galbana.AAC.3
MSYSQDRAVPTSSIHGGASPRSPPLPSAPAPPPAAAPAPASQPEPTRNVQRTFTSSSVRRCEARRTPPRTSSSADGDAFGTHSGTYSSSMTGGFPSQSHRALPRAGAAAPKADGGGSSDAGSGAGQPRVKGADAAADSDGTTAARPSAARLREVRAAPRRDRARSAEPTHLLLKLGGGGESCARGARRRSKHLEWGTVGSGTGPADTHRQARGVRLWLNSEQPRRQDVEGVALGREKERHTRGGRGGRVTRLARRAAPAIARAAAAVIRRGGGEWKRARRWRAVGGGQAAAEEGGARRARGNGERPRSLPRPVRRLGAPHRHGGWGRPGGAAVQPRRLLTCRALAAAQQ